MFLELRQIEIGENWFNRLVELNKQKDRLWLAVEDLYEATDDLKERTWDYDNNRKQVKKLTKEL